MDEETLKFYRGNAEAYAGREITSRQARLTAFLALLPPGARILELGCGAGGDTAEMLARGFEVHATDGSPEMAAVASKRIGRTVETLLFHELDAVAAYDAVWANACHSNSAAASCSAWRLPAHWCTAPRCCWPTNPPATWTPPRRPW